MDYNKGSEQTIIRLLIYIETGLKVSKRNLNELFKYDEEDDV